MSNGGGTLTSSSFVNKPSSGAAAGGAVTSSLNSNSYELVEAGVKKRTRPTTAQWLKQNNRAAASHKSINSLAHSNQVKAKFEKAM